MNTMIMVLLKYAQKVWRESYFYFLVSARKIQSTNMISSKLQKIFSETTSVQNRKVRIVLIVSQILLYILKAKFTYMYRNKSIKYQINHWNETCLSTIGLLWYIMAIIKEYMQKCHVSFHFDSSFILK